MPRQNTSPSDFPPAVLQQIGQLAARIVATRKERGETQTQWAEQLGISQPTMARLEKGDPAVSMATYVACLYQLNPGLDLTQLLAAPSATAALPSATSSIAATAQRSRPRLEKASATPTLPSAEQQAQIARNFAAAKQALDFFKSPL